MASDRLWGDKIYKTVILDTSAILSFFEFSVEWEKALDKIVGGYHLVIPTAVVRELQTLKKQSCIQKKAAAALILIAKYDTIDEEADSADEAVVKIAARTHGIVVTNDRELRNSLKKQELPVIFLRGKKRLVFDE
jgi:rRNA-processing protein FCF1